MKKNTLFHHKKNQRNNFIKTKDHSDARDSLLENPENSAKFCLLEISEEAQKLNNRTFTAFESHHSRSYSTELYPQKKIVNQSDSKENEEKNCINSGRYRKAESHQSVALKSTFSNEMRKTNHFNFHRKDEVSTNQQNGYQFNEDNPRYESLKKLQKINYIPLAVQESKEIEKIDEIFQNTPSRQILAILKRTNLAREITENDKKEKEKSEEKISVRKKSIFNIRHLMMREKIGVDTARKEKESPEMKNESSGQVLSSRDHHSNNNYNVIKMRLKNRYNQSALDKK